MKEFRQIRMGGLMRCCIESIDKYDGPETVGIEIPCIYEDPKIMKARIAPDGIWEWTGK